LVSRREIAGDYRRGLVVVGMLGLDWRRGRSRDDGGRWCGLNGEVVDDGLDAGDLGGVVGGEGACGVVRDGAVEGGDGVLDGGLNGLGADGAVGGDLVLDRVGEVGVAGGRGGRGALAAEGQGDEREGERELESAVAEERGEMRGAMVVHELPLFRLEIWVLLWSVIRA
jgi:hypothetical protein